MSRVYSFHGGVHPPENKRQSLGAPIRQAPLPSRLILPLQQHIGKAATPLVEVGQTVLKGQKLPNLMAISVPLFTRPVPEPSPI